MTIDAVLVFREAKNKRDGLRYCFATFAFTDLEDMKRTSGDRIYREGPEAERLEKLHVGDTVTLDYEEVREGMRSYQKCVGVSITPKQAIISIK